MFLFRAVRGLPYSIRHAPTRGQRRGTILEGGSSVSQQSDRWRGDTMKRGWLVVLVACGVVFLGTGSAVPPVAAQPPGPPPGANQPTLPAVVPVCDIPARINQV